MAIRTAIHLVPLLIGLISLACSGSTKSDGAGSGSSGSSGGSGGSGGACAKLCDGKCVSASDPALGCGSASCAPCVVPHAVATCSATGECSFSTCDNGFADCDVGSLSSDATGCETNVASDPAHCGACGISCTSASGSESCVAGQCQPNKCPANQGDCTGQGTCTPLDTLENCGFCGNACDFPDATGTCVPTPGGSYTCSFKCPAGFADCDALEPNGCETNTQYDVANCGACAVLCDTGPNSTPVCQNETCYAACDTGYSDCDGNLANGCEKPAPSC